MKFLIILVSLKFALKLIVEISTTRRELINFS